MNRSEIESFQAADHQKDWDEEAYDADHPGETA